MCSEPLVKGRLGGRGGTPTAGRTQGAGAPLAGGDPPGIVSADRSLGSGGFRGAVGGTRPRPHVGQDLLDDLRLVVVHVFDGVCVMESRSQSFTLLSPSTALRFA